MCAPVLTEERSFRPDNPQEGEVLLAACQEPNPQNERCYLEFAAAEN